MKDRVTIEDIVQKTGISKSTVSRVLTGKGYVSDEVRNTVKKISVIVIFWERNIQTMQN